ncbi:MAG: GNAT family N-acetyltransferase, partial [Bdellovibrionales bacterium RBG_16_40_8]
ADFAILWTDLYDFYRKLGFELAGQEISFVLEKMPTQQNTGLKFICSEKVSPEALLRLYSQHTCGTMRTAEDIKKYLQIPNSHIYTAWSAQNELMAYAVEGKGADLSGYIHEWGGAVSSLMSLFAHIRNEQNRPITIISPVHAKNLINHLQNWPVTRNDGFLGMIRPVHLENLFFKIRRHARNLGLNDFIIEKKENYFVIGTKHDLATISSLGELTRLVFGPVEPSLLKSQFQNIFPIPMWIWGWDSV